MTALALLRDLKRRGVRLEARDGGLRARIPKGELSSNEVDRIRSHKAEIVRLLSQQASPAEKAAPQEMTLHRLPDGNYAEEKSSSGAAVLLRPAIRLLIDEFKPVSITVRPINKHDANSAVTTEPKVREPVVRSSGRC